MSAGSALMALATDTARGLSAEAARERLRRLGPNAIEARPPTSALAMLARQFTGLPVGMLLGASAVSVLTGDLLDAAVTVAVVGGNASIGFATESGSERIIRSMTVPQTSLVPVVRSGLGTLVRQEDIVPGDILVLKPNVVVAADARLIETEQLIVNEALLTGESEPVEKSAEAVCGPSTPLAERRNLVHKGSFIVSGAGRAVVVATGARTEVGRIDTETRAIETPRTPLERDLDNLGSKLALVSLAACGAFFLTGFIGGRPLIGMLKSAVALAVAAVPEGLPVTATTTLAIGLGELRRKGVIVRRLEAVEGLGSMQVVCFDKTGTLTENRMRLEHFHAGRAARLIGAHETHRHVEMAPVIDRMMEVAVLCSEVVFERQGDRIAPKGSSTEAALAQGAVDHGIDPFALRKRWGLADIAYRSETDRFMRSVHLDRASGRKLIAVKGDPVQVLSMCRLAITDRGKVSRLHADDRRRIQGATDELAGRGLRVLGFAIAEGNDRGRANGALVWLGAAALKDPVAPGVKSLVTRLRGAGIRPIMITGDQAATAHAIAMEIGLNGDRPLRVLESRALERLRPELLAAIARSTDVFARVPPSRKLRIVEALQSSGLIVGMSGDGFNDAPALRAADIAIAVGRDSASAARDVADIIVDGHDLGAIADGVEQGRTILSNIRKAVHYLISTNLSEIIVLVAESLIAGDQLETPMELLWLNLITDILPALGLAFEPPEPDVMSRPPRSSQEPLLAMSDLRHAALESAVMAGGVIGAHAFGLARYGPGPQTRTVTFLSLVTTQLMHALACRHDRFEPLGGRTLFGNGTLNAALVGATALQALAVASPPLRRLLGISAPSLVDLVVAGGTGLAAFAANEAMLAARLRRARDLEEVARA
ncbi:MAG: cation-transporting P-type ATPase [Hyphomicrobiaceae bacterium]|nr:cation-transporting P-type ATPase [Hyphomicrobiaceae bacterium]